MFKQTITLFNYIPSKDTYLTTLLSQCEFQNSFRTIPEEYETSEATSAIALVMAYEDYQGIYVLGSNKKYFKYAKQWNEDTDYFTIQNNTDFIMLGDYTDMVDINLNDIKNGFDNVFVINRFKYFIDDLKHFELYVN